MLSRRSLLGGGAAIAALALGGGVAAAMSAEEELTLSVIDRLIGPINLPRSELDKLIAAVAQRPGYPQGYKLHLVSALERAGWAKGVTDHAGTAIRQDFELLERAILTEVVVGTDYMTVTDRERDRLSYLGERPCSSPFADLSMV